MTLAAESDTGLVDRAKAGNSDAFGELHRRHARAVRGFLRARARNDADTDEIEQQTWINVWSRVASYNPARAPFEAFAKHWAGITILRFYSRTSHGLVLFSSLIDRFPDIEDQSEILDRIRGARALGTSPRVDAETEREALHTYDLALRITFEDPMPPHQYLAFGFVKLLGWKPAALAAEHGATPLRVLAQQFEEAYVMASQLPAARVRPSFTRLRESMAARLGEVVREPKTREAHQALLERVVGDTALRDYAHTPLDASISGWWYAVTRRAGKQLRRAGIARGRQT